MLLKINQNQHPISSSLIMCCSSWMVVHFHLYLHRDSCSFKCFLTFLTITTKTLSDQKINNKLALIKLGPNTANEHP